MVIFGIGKLAKLFGKAVSPRPTLGGTYPTVWNTRLYDNSYNVLPVIILDCCKLYTLHQCSVAVEL